MVSSGRHRLLASLLRELSLHSVFLGLSLFFWRMGARIRLRVGGIQVRMRRTLLEVVGVVGGVVGVLCVSWVYLSYRLVCLCCQRVLGVRLVRGLGVLWALAYSCILVPVQLCFYGLHLCVRLGFSALRLVLVRAVGFVVLCFYLVGIPRPVLVVLGQGPPGVLRSCPIFPCFLGNPGCLPYLLG